MTEQMHYITNEQGERVGVFLDLETYQSLTGSRELDEEYLVGLSESELEALAHSTLALNTQNHLNELLARHEENQLSASEQTELDRLLNQVDQLTILKTRAKYTLQSLKTSDAS